MAAPRHLEPEPEPPDNTAPASNTPFFPDFALREALTALGYLTVLMIVAAVTHPHLDEIGDPNASGYIPRPEWYFLWLFEMLKYFPGEREVIGTFYIPSVLLALVVAVPFLDRRRVPAAHRLLPHTRPVRTWPRLVAAGGLAVVLVLTMRGLSSSVPIKEPGPRLTPVQVAGRAIYERMGCQSCHTIAGEGGTRGPDLSAFGSQPGAEQNVLLHFAGLLATPGSEMPVYQLSPDELRALSEYLLSRR